MFITFEGPEGAGKSTALAALAQRLREMNYSVVTTREPGAGDFGKKIREILLHGEDHIGPAQVRFADPAIRAGSHPR